MQVKTYRKCLQKIQRKLTIRVARAYRTVSFEAVTVVTGMIPIHLLAIERKEIHWGLTPRAETKKIMRQRTLEAWQSEWQQASKGAGTRKLIPIIEPWILRKHGNLHFYLTQVMTGHGCFKEFTCKIGKSEDMVCRYCEMYDTPEHTLFV